MHAGLHWRASPGLRVGESLLRRRNGSQLRSAFTHREAPSTCVLEVVLTEGLSRPTARYSARPGFLLFAAPIRRPANPQVRLFRYCFGSVAGRLAGRAGVVAGAGAGTVRSIAGRLGAIATSPFFGAPLK